MVLRHEACPRRPYSRACMHSEQGPVSKQATRAHSVHGISGVDFWSVGTLGSQLYPVSYIVCRGKDVYANTVVL